MTRRSNLHVYVLFCMIGLGIFAVSGYTLWEDRRKTWLTAEQSSANLLAILSRDIENNVSLIGRSLDGVVKRFSDPEFQRLPGGIRYRWLLDQPLSASFKGSILVFDANGDLFAAANSPIAKRPYNVSESDYFTFHRASPDDGLHLSSLYRRPDGDMSFALSRRISDPAGRFEGVVAAEIPLSDLHTLIGSLTPDQAGSVTVVRDDGTLFMRYPENGGDSEKNRTIPVDRFIREESGSFVGTAGTGEVRGLTTFRRVGTLPLVVSVFQPLDALLAPWWREARVFLLAAGVRLSFVLAMFLLFWRELRRRTRAEEELSRLARTDVLTGLPNRRAFDETFEQEWTEAIRSGSSLSLLYIDADFFKKYNDRHGHGMGDELLCAIANTLNANIRRPRDVAARYGGEEFAMLLPGTDLAGALLVAETMRQAIMTMDVRHEQSPHNVVTVSIGVAAAKPSLGMVHSSLLKAADDALYRAKAAGRNRVRIADGHKGPSDLPSSELTRKTIPQGA